MASQMVEVITKDDLEEILGEAGDAKTVVVEYYSEDVEDCQMIAPVFDELAQKYGERYSQMTFARVNVDSNEWVDGSTKDRVPFFQAVHDGNTLYSEALGGADEDALESMVLRLSSECEASNVASSVVHCKSQATFDDLVGKRAYEFKTAVVFKYVDDDEDCQAIGPVFEELAKEYAKERPNIKFLKLNVDECDWLTDDDATVPSILVLHNQCVVSVVNGPVCEDELKALVDEAWSVRCEEMGDDA